MTDAPSTRRMGRRTAQTEDMPSAVASAVVALTFFAGAYYQSRDDTGVTGMGGQMQAKLNRLVADDRYQSATSCMVSLRPSFIGPAALPAEQLLLPLCECLACSDGQLRASIAQFAVADSWWAMTGHTSIAGTMFLFSQCHHKGWTTVYYFLKHGEVCGEFEKEKISTPTQRELAFGAGVATIVGFSDAPIEDNIGGYKSSFEAMERICQLVRHQLALNPMLRIMEAVLGTHILSADPQQMGPDGVSEGDQRWQSQALRRAFAMINRQRAPGTGENSALWQGLAAHKGGNANQRYQTDGGAAIPADSRFYSLYKQEFGGRASNSAPRVALPWRTGGEPVPVQVGFLHREVVQAMADREEPLRLRMARQIEEFEQWLTSRASPSFRRRAFYEENRARRAEIGLPEGIFSFAYKMHNLWPDRPHFRSEVLFKTVQYMPAPTDRSAAANRVRSMAMPDCPLRDHKLSGIEKSLGQRGSKDGQGPDTSRNRKRAAYFERKPAVATKLAKKEAGHSQGQVAAVGRKRECEHMDTGFGIDYNILRLTTVNRLEEAFDLKGTEPGKAKGAVLSVWYEEGAEKVRYEGVVTSLSPEGLRVRFRGSDKDIYDVTGEDEWAWGGLPE